VLLFLAKLVVSRPVNQCVQAEHSGLAVHLFTAFILSLVELLYDVFCVMQFVMYCKVKLTALQNAAQSKSSAATAELAAGSGNSIDA